MLKLFFVGLILITLTTLSWAQTTYEVKYFDIGTESSPDESELNIKLVKRFQHYNAKSNHKDDVYDITIESPKSIKINNELGKFYIHSLEGYATSVYSLNTLERIGRIKYNFTDANSHLFNDTSVFGYKFRTKEKELNIFKGKPVESCFSHNGKYLWVTFYRRSFDLNAVDPSAVAIIDTETDKIVRVMPTGPLPKMIASSPDNKYVAITHWGDNTIGLVDISSENPEDFNYLKHLVVGKKLKLEYGNDEKIDRDKDCGYCLRGTVFTPDSKYLLVGRMGGGGIAVFNVETREYIRTIWGMQSNIRHLEINNGYLYIGTNVSGYVQKAKLDELIDFAVNTKDSKFTKWESIYIGTGVRTIKVSKDGKYVFAAVNNLSKVVAIRTSDMKKVAEIGADSFPVGMALSEDGKYLMVSSQGRYKVGGGHSVMVFEIIYN